MRAYVAGPMTGWPYFNRPMFDRVAEWLKARGFDVVNPCDQHWNDETDERFADPLGRPMRLRKFYMQHDLPLLMECDAIVLLPEWEMSEGASLEQHCARVCGLAEAVWDEKNTTVWWTRLNAEVLIRA